MPELGTYGSVRGAVGNNRPYRERRPPLRRYHVHAGRRPKASREGTRGELRRSVLRSLWGFERRQASVSAAAGGVV